MIIATFANLIEDWSAGLRLRKEFDSSELHASSISLLFFFLFEYVRFVLRIRGALNFGRAESGDSAVVNRFVV